MSRLQPHQPEYRELRQALGRYRAIAAKGGWPLMPPKARLKPGQQSLPLFHRHPQRLRQPAGDAGITTGRLDDGLSRLERARLFSRVDHGKTDPVLDAAGRVVALDLQMEQRQADQPANAPRL